MTRASLKIGLIIYGSLDTMSGGYLYDRKLVKQLRARGHEVAIFSQLRAGLTSNLGGNFDRRLTHDLMTFNPDVLLQDELNHPSLFALNSTLRKTLRAPIMSIVHHLASSEQEKPWHASLSRHIEQQYLRTVDGFVFNSHSTRQAVEALIGPTSDAIVAYPGRDNLTFAIDEDTIRIRSNRKGLLQIAFVGNVIRRKALHVLINALGHLARDQWHLTVVGNTAVDPTYMTEVQALVQRHHFDHKVSFLGKVSQETLQETLLNSHLLAVPSTYEGFGIVYVEAMGAGLPVIAGKQGATGEVVQHGQTGFLVGQDPAEIAQYIAMLAYDRLQLTAMSCNAYHRYADFPTWSESMTRIANYLETYAD